MQKMVRLSIALLLLIASATFAPPAKATPCTQTFTYYYDCALNQVGEKDQYCNGSVYTWGQLSGAFKEIETDSGPYCTCGDTSDTWYQWNGTSWVLLSGPPSPTC